ncbi:MAG: hypothetical protein ACRC8A_03590 [Microcoleaceae cyanobacterium]
MSESKRDFEPRLSWVLSIVLLSWLVFVPFVNRVKIPIGSNETGVVSLAYIENISPYTDYIKYLILLLIPSLIAALSLILKYSWIERPFSSIISVINHHIVWITITSILLIAWLINIPFNQFTIDKTLIDSFHQGEFLGFLPNFMQLENPFENTVLIHGWGLDVLPTWFATQFISNQNGIALTRFFVNLQNVLACLGYFWILWELTGAVQLGRSRLPIFLISCLIFCIFDGIFFKFDGRRGTWFILQLALTVRFFRGVSLEKSSSQNSGKFLALLVGISLPMSFLYVYDRGIYFLAVYICASGLTLVLNRQLARNWLSNSIVGIILSSITIIIVLGFNQVSAILSQIAYWGKYGRYISFIPLPAFKLTWTSQNFWLPMVIQSAVLVYILLDLSLYKFRVHTFVQKNYLTILLLFTSLIYMRITLDRSDLAHAYHGAIPTSFLVAYLIYLGYEKYLQPNALDVKLNSIQHLLVAILSLIILLTEPGFSLNNAIKSIVKLPIALIQTDSQLLKLDYLEAWTEMQSEIDRQSCFFTLTSEGLWYYLFNKPSCSKYSYLLYAKPTIAQQTVLADLEKTKPEILLFSNEMWFQNPWDEILKSESAALIYQDVMKHYKPYKIIQSHWFWKRSDRPLKFTQVNGMNGFVEGVPTHPVKRGEAISLGGWAILPEKLKPADAVYLSNGQNQLLEAGIVNLSRADVALVLGNKNYEVSGWALRVPTAILPIGTSSLKVWAYDSQDDQFIQVGEEISITVEH